jgi:hypothetical protein
MQSLLTLTRWHMKFRFSWLFMQARKMREAYSSWAESIEKLRDLLERVPPKKSWYEHKAVAEKFRDESAIAGDLLHEVYEVARGELT